MPFIIKAQENSVSVLTNKPVKDLEEKKFIFASASRDIMVETERLLQLPGCRYVLYIIFKTLTVFNDTILHKNTSSKTGVFRDGNTEK